MGRLTHTHTYSVLEISRAAFDEIKGRLLAASYGHAIDGDLIDMHGIALAPEVDQPQEPMEMRLGSGDA